ncbi:TRAP transporter small permease [Aquabacter spiritensis]|uniref:TRAP transporter small permease protein n=1 Tax=Aquabacter spiritensis TaxID=933073 RepID=A0A4R3LZ25_9HYPH|nr:TRAP transporter small permease [Aquabacter spiritensis]TCT03987.1 TRAP-type C4-dicarboxylate transport system permease small subunit [Aquabacter spiritensis]
MTRLFGGLLAGMNGLASLWVLFLVGLISTDVLARSLFNAPLSGVPEIVKFSIVGMVWLQMAYVLRSGNHLRTTLVLAMLPRGGQRLVLVLNALVGIGMFAMIAWLGTIEMAKSYDIGAFEGEYPVRIPVWPIWAILVFGAVATLVQFALDAVRYAVSGPSSAELPEAELVAREKGTRP